MNRPRLIVRIIALLIGVAVGVAVLANRRTTRPPNTELELLEGADQFELLSLNPDDLIAGGPPDYFYDHKVLGKIEITDPATRQRLIEAMRSAYDETNTRMACFDPRHAISVRHGETTTDFLICFQCHQVYVYQNEKKLTDWSIKPAPQAVLDDVLRNANVPLATN